MDVQAGDAESRDSVPRIKQLVYVILILVEKAAYIYSQVTSLGWDENKSETRYKKGNWRDLASYFDAVTRDSKVAQSNCRRQEPSTFNRIFHPSTQSSP